MFVAMVTALARPAWLIISASRAASCGLALSSLCGTPVTSVPSCARQRYSSKISERSSECSTEVVPTSTGRPSQWHDVTRSATAFQRAAAVRNMA